MKKIDKILIQILLLVQLSFCSNETYNYVESSSSSSNNNNNDNNNNNNNRGTFDTECPDIYNVPTLDGRTISAQGFLMPEEKDSLNGQVLDYEKCVYVFFGDYRSYFNASVSCEYSLRGKGCPDCEGELVSIHSSSQVIHYKSV